jgi:hypothetical protein
VLPQLKAVPPLGIILITTLSDFFVKQYIKKDIFTTMRSLSGTVFMAVVGWILIRYLPTKTFLLNNFALVLLMLIPINLFIGKFADLKIKDYIRFHSLLKND